MKFIKHVSTVVLLQMPFLAVAQTTQHARQTHDVTIIELPTAIDGRRAMVFRRAAGSDRDVIGLAPDATAADLGGGMEVLGALYATVGGNVKRDMAAAVDVERTMPRAGERGKLDQALIERLRHERVQDIHGFGNVRAVRIKIPKSEIRKR
jgi:hypothetical protein